MMHICYISVKFAYVNGFSSVREFLCKTFCNRNWGKSSRSCVVHVNACCGTETLLFSTSARIQIGSGLMHTMILWLTYTLSPSAFVFRISMLMVTTSSSWQILGRVMDMEKWSWRSTKVSGSMLFHEQNSLIGLGSCIYDAFFSSVKYLRGLGVCCWHFCVVQGQT